MNRNVRIKEITIFTEIWLNGSKDEKRQINRQFKISYRNI